MPNIRTLTLSLCLAALAMPSRATAQAGGPPEVLLRLGDVRLPLVPGGGRDAQEVPERERRGASGAQLRVAQLPLGSRARQDGGALAGGLRRLLPPLNACVPGQQ